MAHIHALLALLGVALATTANTNTNRPMHDPIPSQIHNTPETQSTTDIAAPSSTNALDAEDLAHVLNPDPITHERQLLPLAEIDPAAETEVYGHTRHKGPVRLPPLRGGGGGGGGKTGAGSTLSAFGALKGVGFGVMVVVVGVMGYI
ncbi:hypothetical protein C8A01DRAFT_34465 [Parachaetomium inaequale]|uniref:Uncharacterized protein n=1 Tax=Parachaetomium inaequale TaxID=2588326 RepID=A0AAN6STK4_9PEZI|nr:hypothetical protein C8A01DRAFT_34465 [Parachaetomium inaequale]